MSNVETRPLIFRFSYKFTSCKLESYKLFFKGLRYLIKPLERLQVNTLELEIGNFCFPFSIFLTVSCRFDPNSTTTAKGGGK